MVAPTVSILFVTYNSAGVIAAAIQSLPAGIRVLVVDNASDDDTLAVCGGKDVEIIALDENVGYGAAANIGVMRTDTDYVFLLNPDILLQDGCVDVLLEAAEAHRSVGLFGPSQFRHNDGVIIDHDKPTSLLVPVERTGTKLAANVQEVDFLLGSAYFIRREAFDAIGGFDEELFLFYEDDDFCRRLRDAGWSRALVGNAFCQHAVGQSSPVTPDLVYAKNWHIAWSECYARTKHGMPVPMMRPLLQMGLKIVLHFLTGNRMRRAKAAGAFRGRRDFAKGIRAQDRRIAKGKMLANA